MMEFPQMVVKRGFTLIELLIVIGIVAIISAVTVLVLNPAELLRQARDSNRLSDYDTLNRGFNLLGIDTPQVFGNASTTYISIPDPAATSTAGTDCSGVAGFSSLPPSWIYHCAASSTYRNVNGTGWMPVNFGLISSGAPFGTLPVDPVNTAQSGFFYAYVAGDNRYVFTIPLESEKYLSKEKLTLRDQGTDPTRLESGTNLLLWAMAQALADVAPPTGVGNISPANGATNVSLTPALTAATATDVSPPVSYAFELYQSNLCFGTPDQTRAYATASTWTPTALPTGTTYAWRNKTRDSASTPNESAFSSCWTFTTQAMNYVANGDFATGNTTAWTPYVYPVNGSVSVVSDAGNYVLQMQVDTVADPPLTWHVQTWQADQALNTLQANTIYTLTFRAKASVAHKMFVSLSCYAPAAPYCNAQAAPYVYLGLKIAPTVGTSWQTYSVNFQTVGSMPSGDVKLGFEVGQALGTVWLDDVSLTPAPITTYAGSDLQLSSFDPTETWLAGAIQNSPNPPDVTPSDTTHVHEGTAALKLTAGVNAADFIERGIKMDMSASNWQMTMWVYVDNPVNLGNIRFAVQAPGQGKSSWVWAGIQGLQAGWNQVVMPKTSFYRYPFQSPMAWGGLYRVGIKLETNDNGPVNIWVDDLRVIPVTTDIQPPLISFANVYPLTSTTATFTWTTNDSSNSQTNCGTTTAYGTITSSGSLTTSHSLNLTGLIPNTTYHCQLSSTDSSGNTGRSGDLVFQTDPLAAWVLPDAGAAYKSFLYGINGFSDILDVQEAERTRFSTFYSPSLTWSTNQQVTNYLNEAQANNRLAYPAMDSFLVEAGNLTAIQTDINAFKNHPAVGGWHLYDEPELYPSVTVQEMNDAYTAIKDVDPGHEILFASTAYSSSYAFINALDVGVIEAYPYASPASSILGQLTNAQSAGKPFDVALQAWQADLQFTWPGENTNVQGSTYPSATTLRNMAYLSLNHGARNIGVYGYIESHVLPANDWLWMNVNLLNNELMRLAPVWRSTDTPTRTLTSSDNSNLDVGVKQYNGKTYVTVVNKSGAPATGTLTFSGSPISSVKEVVGQRAVDTSPTSFSDSWSAYGVNIYEL